MRRFANPLAYSRPMPSVAPVITGREWVSLIERMKVHEGLYVLQEVVHI